VVKCYIFTGKREILKLIIPNLHKYEEGNIMNNAEILKLIEEIEERLDKIRELTALSPEDQELDPHMLANKATSGNPNAFL